MSNTKPNIDNLPLDLFGDESGATSEPVVMTPEPPPAVPAPTPNSATAAPVSAPPPSPLRTGPFPANDSAVSASTIPMLPRRLRRLYDVAGILGITVAIGILFGGFTWRILFILLLSAGGYIWLLKQTRPRYYARMERFRERIEHLD